MTVARRARPRPGPLALVFVVLFHLGWLFMWSAALRPSPAERSAPQTAVVRLSLRLRPPPPVAPAPPQAPAAPVAARAAARDTRTLVSVPKSAPERPWSESLQKMPDTPAASAAPSQAQLIDTDATRRAIREIARERALHELAAETGNAPHLSPQDRLGQEIGRSARVECLKGEYFGGGAGLLSLPFWIIAEMREKCRR